MKPGMASCTTCDDPVVIKAVFFDGDQTLWDFEVLMRRSLSATLTHLHALRPCMATEDLDIELVVADREAVACELRGTETNLERIRLAAFSRTLSRLGLQDDDLAAQLNAYYLEHRFDNVELFPEVVEVLAVLSQSYVLGLLSNGNGYPERSGLGGTFAAVIFSQDHGVEKPDRELFDVAAAEVGCGPDEIVMVGDSLPNDVRGAQDAGWRGIWLNRDGRDRADRFTPDAELSDLVELPEALHALRALPAIGRNVEVSTSPIPSPTAGAERVAEFSAMLELVRKWGQRRADIQAVGLAGSWARGTQHPGSDADFVVLTATPEYYELSTDWIRDALLQEAPVARTQHWGPVVERRLLLASGFELEFGFATPAWAETEPVDSGTARVVGDGFWVLYDPLGILGRLVDESACKR